MRNAPVPAVTGRRLTKTVAPPQRHYDGVPTNLRQDYALAVLRGSRMFQGASSKRLSENSDPSRINSSSRYSTFL